jgi:hypothetical protein
MNTDKLDWEKMTREEWDVLSTDVYLEIRRQEYIGEQAAPLAGSAIEEPYYTQKINIALQFRAMLHEYRNRESGPGEAPPSTSPAPKQIPYSELLIQFIRLVCEQLSPPDINKIIHDQNEIERIVDEKMAKMTADDKPEVLQPAESLVGKTPEELGLKGPACAEKNKDQPDGYYAEGKSIFLKTTIGGQPCFTEVAKCRGEKAAAGLIAAIKGGAR